MEEANSVVTPVDKGVKLVKSVLDDKLFDQKTYQSAIGSLHYLSVATRPHIAFAVSNVAKFCEEPTTQHWSAVKTIMMYLIGIADMDLRCC